MVDICFVGYILRLFFGVVGRSAQSGAVVDERGAVGARFSSVWGRTRWDAACSRGTRFGLLCDEEDRHSSCLRSVGSSVGSSVSAVQ